jgi:hypothetical protein
MEDLAELAGLVTGFAAREHLTIVPAVPQHDCGPEVCLGPAVLDLLGFLDLARQLGGGVVYPHATPFDPAAVDGDQPEDQPAHLLRHMGQAGQISVAFAANGLVHFWEHHAAWFAEWEELADATVTRPGIDVDDGTERLSPEERARLVTELAEAILADSQFRGAPRGDKLRAARRLIPEETSKWVGWDAAREACERVNQTAQERYDQLEGRLDDLAAELLASPAYQRTSSPAARKQAAERFVIPHADGFFPPALARDELYARAQELAKAARTPASGLF